MQPSLSPHKPSQAAAPTQAVAQPNMKTADLSQNQVDNTAPAKLGRKAIAEGVRALRLEKQPVSAPRRTGRALWLTLALLALLGGGAYAYSQGWNLPAVKSAVELDTLPVVKERLLDILLDTTGYVSAERIVKVNPRLPGMVVELNIAEGQRVEKDALLARLDDEQYRADLDQARAAVKSAEAALAEAKLGARDEEIARAKAALRQAEVACDLTRRHHQRAETIRSTIAPAEYDRVVAAAREAEAAVAQAQQAVKLLEQGPRAERLAVLAAEAERAKALVAKAEYFIDATQIRAPLAGTVLSKSVELGEIIRGETMTGTSFCTLADLEHLEAEIDIQERDLAAIRLGQPCLIIPEAYPDREYSGRLEWLAPVYNRQRGVRRAKIEIEKPDALLAPDMNCRVQVLRSAPGSAELVRLPLEALAGEGSTQYVWLLDDGVARRRDVRVGNAADGKVEIREGLAGGETLLLPGDVTLSDGQPVRAKSKPGNAAKRKGRSGI